MATNKSSIVTLDDNESEAVNQAAASWTDAVIVSGKNNDPELSGKKATLTIHVHDDEQGAEAVFVGLNGFGYQVPRGVPCKVPVELVEVLGNAIMRKYPTNGGIVVGSREVPRHSFVVSHIEV